MSIKFPRTLLKCPRYNSMSITQWIYHGVTHFNHWVKSHHGQNKYIKIKNLIKLTFFTSAALNILGIMDNETGFSESCVR